LQLYNHLRPPAATPDLVIYLQASVDQLLARIQRRGRGMERSISAEYLTKLSDAYTQYFYDYDESPLLIVNSDRFNFADDPAHFEILLRRVESIRGGKEYMNAA
jgi:deoxyadenosine/deoxycytidine kinase